MARIVHGFHLGKNKYYFFIIGGIVILISLAIFSLELGNRIKWENLLTNLGLSIFRLICAYAISLICAVAIAIPISQKKIGDVLIPVFDLMQNLPSFALIPVFILIFGYSNKMVIVFAATSILWPILFYALYALKRGRDDLNDAAAIFGAIGWKKIIYYLFPVIFPAVITGSIVGISIGWEAIIGIEIIGMNNGIGYLLSTSLSQNKILFSVGLLSLLIFIFLVNRLIWMPLIKKSQFYE